VTKGGDIVLAALQLVRERAPEIRLTVAGPAEWPLGEGPPDGVDFLGRVPIGAVAKLMDSHDLLLMPSRIEGFGIVFVEALARGLPCIARKAFAMPELVRPGYNGDLVESDDPATLAKKVLAVLADDRVYERTAFDAPEVARYFTWDRAASDLLAAVAGTAALPRWSPGAAAEERSR
jgi:glycosyltransferase involved in cell wall biosynthesis